MTRSGWAAGVASAAVALALVLALGSRLALEATSDADEGVRPLMSSLTTFPAWNADALGADSDLNLAILAKVFVLLLGVFFLGAAAGRAGSPATAVLAGWGAFVVSSAVAGAVFYLVADLQVFDGELADRAGGALAPMVREVNAGAAFALYTGGLIGTAVALARRREVAAEMVPALPEEQLQPPPRQPVPVATWPPTPVGAPAVSAGPTAGTTAPSPAWVPPQSVLPAVPLPRRGGAYTEPRPRVHDPRD